MVTGSTANWQASPDRSAPQALTEVCPHFHAAIELIGKRWSGAIIWALSDGPMRFAELKRSIPGLSDRLLSQRLRELEDAGLMSREVDDGPQVKVIYSLTEMGEGLRPAVLALREWACRWQDSLPRG